MSQIKDEVRKVLALQKAYQDVPHGANWVQFANAVYSLFREHGDELVAELARDGALLRAGEYFSEHDLEALGLSADWNIRIVVEK